MTNPPERRQRDQSEVVIGAVDRAFGVRGELVVTSLTDVPGRFHVGLAVRIEGPQGRSRDTTVRAVRQHGERLIVGLEGIETPEAVAEFRGGYLHASRGTVAAPDGQFFQCDLLGLSVVDTNGKALGEITQIVESGAQQLFVVRQGTQEVLIPAAKAWVVRVDVAARTMTVVSPDAVDADTASLESSSQGLSHAL